MAEEKVTMSHQLHMEDTSYAANVTEGTSGKRRSSIVPAEVNAGASTAAAHERKMSLLEGVRLYPKAIFFSVGLSLAVVMEGYDTWLLTNFYGLPTFAQKFGSYAGSKNGSPVYQLSASWQNALNNGTAAAQIIGLFINGIVSEKFGYRYTMIGALAAITCFIFIQFFAVNIQMLLAGYILSGLPWYVFWFLHCLSMILT